MQQIFIVRRLTEHGLPVTILAVFNTRELADDYASKQKIETSVDSFFVSTSEILP